jgi:hypothetical protein
MYRFGLKNEVCKRITLGLRTMYITRLAFRRKHNELKLVSVTINRDAHPNALFGGLQNEKGESINVRVHVGANQNVDNLTLGEIERLAHEAARQLKL